MDLTQLHLDVAFGRAGGRVIWQPRILAWFDDREFRGEPLPAPYTGMTRPEVYHALGCSNRLYEYGDCFVAHEDPRVRLTKNWFNEREHGVVWDTPVGQQRAEYRQTPDTFWAEPVKWPISDEHDMKIATWRAERRTWSWNKERFEELNREWAGLGAPTMYICRTTVQQLFHEDMGVEAGMFAVMDYPATCDRYFTALTESQERLIDVINASPVQIINFGDNLHSSLLPPDWFEKYILPVYQRRCELLHSAGKFVHSHWDGDCGPLLPYARDTGLDGIEAITPQPQGDVTLEETKAALGDDMYLLDGIPAVYFDDTFSTQTLIDCARRCIDLFAPKLILGISDEMSSTGDIERIRLVGEVVDEYNACLTG